MSFRILATFALLAFQVLNGIASPAAASADEELIQIPGGGLIPKSNLHRIPEGGKLIHTPTEVHLLAANGKLLHTAPVTKSSHTNLRNRIQGTTAIGPRNLQSALVAAVVQPATFYSILSTWTVPPAPQVNVNNPLLMYFPALSPPSGDALIQPVLQWGVSAAGGGRFWSLASWFITGNQAFVTPLTTLPTGTQTVQPFIINQDQFLGTPTTHAWYFGFEFFQPQTGVNIQTAETFNVVFAALEITNATIPGNLPNQQTNINSISLGTVQGSFLSPIPWSLTSDAADGVTIADISTRFENSLLIRYPQ